MVESFKSHGVRVVLGSPGCVGKKPSWVGDTNAHLEDMNLNLCKLRNIDIEIAKREKTGFADVFWPMLTEAHAAELKYGPDFALSGKDGVHPDWAGHVVMAYAFLHGLGLDGAIGTFKVDLRGKKASVTAGHKLLGFENGELKIESHRYPFCIGDGDAAKDNNLRAGTMLAPFNQDLNRLMLVVKHADAKSYSVTWGNESMTFSGEQLSKGINLAAEFTHTPFDEAFAKVDKAVLAKQEFETKQIKETFRSKEAKADMEGTVAKSEAERAPLAVAVREAFVPVTHTLKIVAQ
jgi:hypothetical protein